MFERLKLRGMKAKLEFAQYKKAVDIMESLPDFVKDDDEDNWTALGSGKEVYTEQEVEDMQAQASDLYYKNPLAKGIIETLVNFVVGKEVRIDAEDEDPKVQAYWDKFAVENDWDRKSKEIVRRSFIKGEVFIRFFSAPAPDGDDLKTEGEFRVPKIRFVEPCEIVDENHAWSFGIETDPDDIEKVVRYHRKFQKVTAAGDRTTEDDTEVLEADEIIHVKINADSNMKRGVSVFVGVASWITKYRLWLEDRFMLNKIRTMFNLIGKTASTAPDTAASQFADSTKAVPAGGTADKRIPKPGTLLFTRGIDWKYEALNINAGDTKEDGRAFQLMVAKGINLPEYIVTGDSSNSNYASTMVAESPAIRAFEGWQDEFEDWYQKIYAWVIAYGIKNEQLSEESKKTKMKFDPEKGEDVPDGEGEVVPTSLECQVEFPSLVHRDVKAESEALGIQLNNGLVSERTASQKLGYDYEAEKEQIEKENVLAKKGAEAEADADRHAGHMAPRPGEGEPEGEEGE